MTDEIGSSTLISCGFKIAKGDAAASEQGPKTPFTPIPGPSSSDASFVFNLFSPLMSIWPFGLSSSKRGKLLTPSLCNVRF